MLPALGTPGCQCLLLPQGTGRAGTRTPARCGYPWDLLGAPRWLCTEFCLSQSYVFVRTVPAGSRACWAGPLPGLPPGPEGLPQQRDLLCSGGEAGSAKGSGAAVQGSSRCPWLTLALCLRRRRRCQGKAGWKVWGLSPAAW